MKKCEICESFNRKRQRCELSKKKVKHMSVEDCSEFRLLQFESTIKPGTFWMDDDPQYE